jgi:hypothetical protein
MSSISTPSIPTLPIADNFADITGDFIPSGADTPDIIKLHSLTAANRQHIHDAGVANRDMSLWEATMTTSHSGVGWGGQEMFLEGAYDGGGGYDPDWDISQEDYDKDGMNYFVLDSEIASGRIRNHSTYLQAVERSKHMRDANAAIDAANWASSLLMQVPVQLLDPVNAPELALGFMTTGWSLVARVATGAVATGATAYLQEDYIQEQTSTLDEEAKTNVAMFAALLGGLGYGLAGLGAKAKHIDATPEIPDSTPSTKLEGSSPTVGTEVIVNETSGVKVKVIKKEDVKKGDSVVVEYNNGTVGILGQVRAEDVPSMGSRFAWSLHGRMMKSTSKIVRALGGAMDIGGTQGTKQLLKNDTMSFVADKVKNRLFESVGLLKETWKKSERLADMSEDDFWSNAYVEFAKSRNVDGTPNSKYVDPTWKDSNEIIGKMVDTMGIELEAAGMNVKEMFDINRMFNLEAIRDMPAQDVIDILTEGLRTHHSRKGLEGLDDIASGITTLRQAVDKLVADGAPASTITKAKKKLQKAEEGRQGEIDKVLEPVLKEQKEIVARKAKIRREIKTQLNKKIRAEEEASALAHNKEVDALVDQLGLSVSEMKSLVDDPEGFLTRLTLKSVGEAGEQVASIVSTLLKKLEAGEDVLSLFTKVSKGAVTLATKARLKDELADVLKSSATWKEVSGHATAIATKIKTARVAGDSGTSIREEAQSIYDTLSKSEGAGDLGGKRSRNINTAAIAPLLITDMRDVVATMARDQSGRIALGQVYGIGIDNMDTFLKEQKALVIEEYKGMGWGKNKAVRKANEEIKLLEKSMKLRLNKQLTPDDPNSFWQHFKVFNMNMNMATLGGGMSSTALQSELGVVVARGSMGNALKHVGMSFGEFRQLISGMPPSTSLMRQIQLMTGAFDVFNGSAASRAIDGIDVFSGAGVAAKVIRTSQKAAEGVAKWTGLSTVTSAYRMALGSTVLEDLFFNTKLVTALSKQNRSAYTRLQVDVDQIHVLQSKAKEVFKLDSKGGIESMDLTKLNDPELENMVHRALSNVSQLDILKGDKMHLPEMFSNGNNPLLPLFTQFLSYPMQAYESLLIRGASEVDARLAAGVSTSVAFASFLGLAKEEMEIKMGLLNAEERKYGFDNQGLFQLGLNAINKGAISSPLATAMNYLSAGLTGGRLGSDWQQDHFASIFMGPTASRMQDLFKSLKNSSMNPFDMQSNAWRTEYGRSIMLNSFLPMYTLPVVGKYMQELNKDAKWQ